MRLKQLETLIEQETHKHLPNTLHHDPGNPEPRRRDQRGCRAAERARRPEQRAAVLFFHLS